VPISPIRSITTKVWGLSFDGVDDYMSVTLAQNTYGAVTLEILWNVPTVWRTDINPLAFILRFASGHSITAYFPWFYGYDDDLTIYGYTTANVGQETYDGMAIGDWVHIAVIVYSDHSDVYRNAVQQEPIAFSEALDISTIDKLVLSDLVKPLKGCIAIIRIYNRALAEDEILDNYRGYVTTDGLVLWLWANELLASGNVWRDRSGYGHHATIYGASWVETPRIEFAKPTRLIAQTRLISPTR